MREKLSFASLSLPLVITVSILSGVCTSVTIAALFPFFWRRSLAIQTLVVVLLSIIWAAIFFVIVSRYSLPYILSSPIKYRANWLLIFLGSVLLFLSPISNSIISLSRAALTSQIANASELGDPIWFHFLGLTSVTCVSAIFFVVSILLIPGVFIKNRISERVFQSTPLLLILTANYFYLVGDFNYRLSIWNEDVGTILVPYYLKNPAFYANDLWMSLSWRLDLVSLPTMITTFLYMVVNIKPEIPTFILFYLQNVLIYFAVFRLAMVITQKREIAWLSTFFAFFATPWAWNIAALVPPQIVYSQDLALPFAVFAASYFLESRFGVSMLLLGMAGLIHPTLAFEMIAILGLYLLWHTWKTGVSGFQWRKWLLLIAVAVITALPAMLLNWGVQQVPYEDAISVIRKAGHLNPWLWGIGCDYCNVGFYRGVPIISMFLILALFSLRSFSNRANVVIFLKVVLTATIIMCLAHVISLYLGVAPIARMVLIRSTILLVVFALPLFVYALWDKFKISCYPSRVVILFCFLVPSITNFVALAFILAAQLFKQKKKFKLYYLAIGLGYLIITLGILVYSSMGDFPWLGQIIYSQYNYPVSYALNFFGPNLVWIIFYIALIPNIKQVIQQMFDSQGKGMITTEKTGLWQIILGIVLGFSVLATFFLEDIFFLRLILFIIVIIFIWICQSTFWEIDLISKPQTALDKFSRKAFNFTRNMLDAKTRHISSSSTLSLSALLLIAIIIPSILINSKGIGNSLDGDVYRCNYETQRWAKENTDAKAKFILHYPGRYPLLYTWRTLTGRALVQYYSGVGLYLTDLEVKRYGDELVDFYSGYFNLPADHGYKYNTFPYEEYFSRLDAAGLQQFSKRFGGDYIVQLIETKPLNLPITYQSDCLVIYKIDSVQ